MPLRRLSKGVAEAWEVPRDLLLRRYPRFVTGGPLEPDEIPVFAFHGAEPEDFGRKLDHLARNGYVTLSTDEYVAVLRRQRPAPGRAVLLTFDDGRGSFWSVASPLLARHGMKATVFLVPGRMRSRPALGPRLDDAAAASLPREALLRETGEGALMSWQEVEALARTGLFDFQSHTLLHARVHVAPRLAGFVTPVSQRGYAAFDQPLVAERDRDLLGEEVALGTPLLASAPRTSDSPRFLEDPAVRRACVELVAEEGAEAFFARTDWERRLRQALRGTQIRGRAESEEERTAAIRRELGESRQRIEQHTGGRVVHLCYPWHTAGALARRLAAEAGYETAFCGKVEGVPVTRPGGDLERLARIGEDFVELLPGRGRATLAQVLRRKWARRFGGRLR
ncbi:MAG TPA: polysaccharide deacetylase family protein [Vicinamibacteria bacterium]|nr:polysaccharide deacetylase family protein [Vicinamibacteria bacterium]